MSEKEKPYIYKANESLGYFVKFDDILEKCHEKLLKKRAEYGDSWADSKKFSMRDLDRRLQGEIAEYMAADSAPKVLEEIIDVINLALMVGQRTFNLLEEERAKDAL